MLLIFDCDGVLVDSERLACEVDAAYLQELGVPLTADDVARRFIGTTTKHMAAELTREYAQRIPAGFG
jgi:beta-phosphoglucomutase-like phosphatase (HAD superfamily)